MKTINVYRLPGMGYVAHGVLFHDLADLDSYVADFFQGSALFVQDADASTAEFWRQAHHKNQADYWGTTREHRKIINAPDDQVAGLLAAQIRTSPQMPS